MAGWDFRNEAGNVIARDALKQMAHCFDVPVDLEAGTCWIERAEYLVEERQLQVPRQCVNCEGVVDRLGHNAYSKPVIGESRLAAAGSYVAAASAAGAEASAAEVIDGELHLAGFRQLPIFAEDNNPPRLLHQVRPDVLGIVGAAFGISGLASLELVLGGWLSE